MESARPDGFTSRESDQGQFKRHPRLALVASDDFLEVENLSTQDVVHLLNPWEHIRFLGDAHSLQVHCCVLGNYRCRLRYPAVLFVVLELGGGLELQDSRVVERSYGGEVLYANGKFPGL